jgi:hypothetical protein
LFESSFFCSSLDDWKHVFYLSDFQHIKDVLLEKGKFIKRSLLFFRALIQFQPMEKLRKDHFLNMNPTREKFGPELMALWYDGKGDWNKAHDQVDQLPGKSAARIHAYLHRKEGDLWNADYWYKRAGEIRPSVNLEEEWLELLERFWN